jgi:uncharacterized protein with NRDE domain
MCTLLAVVPEAGDVLQVAANRDEFLARPALPPARWPGAPSVLAPRDVQAGGTWLGVNAHRLFVAVTNRHGAAHDARRASRGQLVADALRQPSVEALHARLAGLGPTSYNPFHLFYADASGHAGLTVCDGTAIRQRFLPPGLHVLTERSFGAGDDSARVARAKASLPESKGRLGLAGWRKVLSAHSAQDARAGTCIHAEARGYGTRSAFVLQLSADCRDDACAWTEGPPCTSPWVDGSTLLKEVLGC